MSDDRDLGLDTRITRKDFLNAALLGAGVALLGAAAPGWARTLAAQVPVDTWAGFGGTGDYAWSNGNTKAVLDAAHRVRDGATGAPISAIGDTGAFYDVVI